MTPSRSTFWLRVYRTMLVIRFFETRVERLFTTGVIHGTTHPATGQEATAVGACFALRPGDRVTSNHRGHGHFIAFGGDPGKMMAELFGKATGYSGGRGGSQLMADYQKGFIGGNGITGGSIPVATGIALSLKLRKKTGVTLCFFGDGAASQGTFHESLNMAGLWTLPVVYLCENNGYAMSTPVCKTIPLPHIADRATAYGIPGVIVDGNDVREVYAAVLAAGDRARRGKGPTLIECKTYRLSGHSRGDPRVYRTREEETAWWAKDPIARCRAALKKEGLLNTARDRFIRREAREIVRQAERFARQSPNPDPSRILEGLFS